MAAFLYVYATIANARLCRASSLIAEVNADSNVRMRLKLQEFRAPLADFNIGDAVQITVSVEVS